jgi:hypothetical protein
VSEWQTRPGIFIAGMLTGIAITFACLVALWVSAHKEPPLSAPAQGYVLRRVEMRLVDGRTFPDRSHLPSWVEPKMTFTCIEDRKP